MIGQLHNKLVHGRRTTALADCIAKLLPCGSSVLDVGCGDGIIDLLLRERRGDIQVRGIDVLVRQNAHIPVTRFDGLKIPFPDRSFDAVLLIDVLHHTQDPRILLAEAVRVGAVLIIKDHLREGLLAGTTLRAMDWVGNARYGVSLPYNYWTRQQWKQVFDELDLVIEKEVSPRLYPVPLSWVFGRRLHFISRLRIASSDQTQCCTLEKS